MTVTVLSKPACVQCNATYKGLDARGISYNIVDMSEDFSALEKAKELGHLRAPVVLVNDGEDHWSGYRPDKLDQLASALKEV